MARWRNWVVPARLGALGVALYSYAVPTADLADASQEDRDAFAAQLRTVFARPARARARPCRRR